MEDKFILDACCGKRMMWFDKKQENTIYQDERLEVNPTTVGDFRDMNYKDKFFKLVVFDPPHIIQKEIGNSNVAKDYGVLSPDNWKDDLKKGFKECMRVLEDYGILIFKWSDCNKYSNISRDCNIKTILELIDEKPLFGHTSRKNKNMISSTYWFCFMKIPSHNVECASKEKKE